MDSSASQFGGVWFPRLLPCSQLTDGAFGEGAWGWGICSPSAFTWLDFGWEASGTPAELKWRCVVERMDLDSRRLRDGILTAWCACAGGLRQDPFPGGFAATDPGRAPRDIAKFSSQPGALAGPLPPVASVPHWTGLPPGKPDPPLPSSLCPTPSPFFFFFWFCGIQSSVSIYMPKGHRVPCLLAVQMPRRFWSELNEVKQTQVLWDGAQLSCQVPGSLGTEPERKPGWGGAGN